jgi:hypothetical protein
LRRSAIGCELAGEWLSLSLRRICSDLVQVEISVSCFQFSLDLFSDSVDRSKDAESLPMTALPTKLVRTERTFYFIGAMRREVVYSVAAANLDDAWHKFHSSQSAGTEILLVIKSETEIYLA